MDNSDSNMMFAYECYHAPCSYYIEPQDGKAFYMLGQEVNLNQTVSWIDDHKYKTSCSKFKAPAPLPDWKLYWGEAKWSIREKYDQTLRETIELYLRKVNFTYVVDLDNEDYYNNVSLHQKRDRQIIFIITMLFWIVETIYETLTAPPAGQKKKSKSIISSSFNDVQPEEGTKSTPQKAKREKIE